jgi:hypothetical protein
MPELRSQGSQSDLLIRLKKNTDPKLNQSPRRLATYTLDFVSPALVADKNFVFSRPAVKVTLQYDKPAAAGDKTKTVGVLWWNGVRWIKVDEGEVDPILNTLSFYTALPGTFQVQEYQVATELTLDKSNIYPRIFSPNGDTVNDVVYFVVENPRLSPLEGKIYDLSGGEVANLLPAGAGAPTADTLVWDGKDNSGNVVPSGVYLYQIKGEGKTINGTVVAVE